MRHYELKKNGNTIKGSIAPQFYFAPQPTSIGMLAGLRAPLADHELPLQVRRERVEVGVSETLADLHRGGCGRGGRLEVARGLRAERGRDQQVPAFRAFLVAEEALRAGQPATRRAHLAP